jgi:signal transduction histidine kinase/CheY-like chemotaxis protein
MPHDKVPSNLDDSPEHLDFVLKAGGLGVWRIDLGSGEMTCSALCKANFGVEANSPFSYEDVQAMIWSNDLETWKSEIDRALRDGEIFEVEYRIMTKAGENRWIHVRGRVGKDDSGKPVHLSGVTRDVTIQKKFELERITLLKKAEDARKIAEDAGRLKDDFLATLSHELRTPLNAILGWVQVLRSDPEISEDIAEGLAIIERNAHSQAQIIGDLLDISRIIAGKIRLEVQEVELADIIKQAIETAKNAARVKSLRIEKILENLPAPISGDPNRLQQIFWNLISNAIKFTPKGGKIQIILARVNSHIEVNVVDTGQGIDPIFLPFVFDRFRQADASTSRRQGGLGIGLAIVKQLVELHGGTVSAHSEGLNLGARFTVILPLTIMKMPVQDEVRRHPGEQIVAYKFSALVLNGLRVLVVDDEADARALVKKALQDVSAHVTTADSGQTALRILETQAFDVMILDIGMPGMDGYTLIERIREGSSQNADTPAIALTAYARSEDRIRALRFGFHMHLAKPVDISELVTVVGSLSGKPRRPS